MTMLWQKYRGQCIVLWKKCISVIRAFFRMKFALKNYRHYSEAKQATHLKIGIVQAL